MREWLKKHWKVVAAVAAGAVGLYLLWQRSQSAGGGAPAAADTGSGLPSTGPPPASSPTANAPAASYLNAGEQAAAGYASQYSQPQTSAELYGPTEQTPGGIIPTSNLPLENIVPGATLTGVIKEKWAQAIYQGQIIWEDKSGKGRNALTDVQAQTPALENTGYGPYANGKPNTINAIRKVVNLATQILGGSQGMPISANDQIYQQAPVTTPAPSVSPVPLGPPVPRATVQHVPGPTTPAGIPNHAVGVH